MSSLSQLTDETNLTDKINTSPPSPAPSPASFFSGLWARLKFYINLIYSSFGLYMLWICIHYGAVQLYVYYCAQPTLYGFLISPFLSSALHCKALNWAIYNSAHIIDHMWILLGTWICSKILINIVM